MKRSIRIISLTLCIILLLLSVSACGASLYTRGKGELKIVATVFFPFDIARAVTGDNAEITLLQSNGADLHDYSPSTSALSALNDADIFICIGGVSDKWTEDAITASENPEMRVIRLTELCEGRLTELEGHSHSEWCEEHHGHDHGHEHQHSADDGHGHTADEHIWLSPKNAVLATEAISSACADADPDRSAEYLKNASEYIASLLHLDAEYRAVADASEKRTLVCADRFPFIYLTNEYGICHFAAFSGCSSETDASFATAVRLIEAVEHNDLGYIFVTESTDGRLAESIASATGCEILTLNSLQSVTAGDIDSGATYLSIMKENLETLKRAI